MATYTEGAPPLEFLIWEAHPGFCREKVTVVSGTAAMKAGRVIGKITASGKFAHYDNAASNGTEVAAGVLMYDVDASAADAEVTVLRRGPALVKAGALGWGANDSTGITAGTADLALLDIIARAD